MKIIYLFALPLLLMSCHTYKIKNHSNNNSPSFSSLKLITVDTTGIQGQVTEKANAYVVRNGLVQLFQNDTIVATTETDSTGNFTFFDLASGNYDIEFCYTGFPCYRITGNKIEKNFLTILNVQLGHVMDLQFVEVISITIPMVSPDNLTSGQTLTSELIRQRRSSN